MGVPIQFAEADFVLGPPADCSARAAPIPVLRLPAGFLVSCWQLSPEELEEVIRTGKMWLRAAGRFNHPHVELAAIKAHVMRDGARA